MKQSRILSILVLFVALFLVTTTPMALAQTDYTIMTAQNAELGNFLVDGQGRSLYYFTKDAPGVSNCKGQCAVIWPPFFAEKIVVPTGLDAQDFDVITRDDGAKQTTFKGWPLYYFSKDTAAGDIKGQNVNGVWFVVKVNQ